MFTKRNITAAWAASGLFPLDPDRVLQAIPEAQVESIILQSDEMSVQSFPREIVRTPVTPVSAEALTSLHHLIELDAHTLNDTSIARLQRHVQKLANAAHTSFAERALLHDHNQLLTRINNEAKARRLTKSVVLGKAKVMSYEDIEEARAKRAAKEVGKGKRTRGQKRTIAALDADTTQTSSESNSARVIEDVGRGRAPVAQMY